MPTGTKLHHKTKYENPIIILACSYPLVLDDHLVEPVLLAIGVEELLALLRGLVLQLFRHGVPVLARVPERDAHEVDLLVGEGGGGGRGDGVGLAARPRHLGRGVAAARQLRDAPRDAGETRCAALLQPGRKL